MARARERKRGFVSFIAQFNFISLRVNYDCVRSLGIRCFRDFCYRYFGGGISERFQLELKRVDDVKSKFPEILAEK